MVAGGGARGSVAVLLLEADVASSSFVDRRRSGARQRIRLVVVTFDRPRKSSSRSTRTPYRAARCVSMWTRRALALALVAWCALTRAPFRVRGRRGRDGRPGRARSGRVPICVQSCEIVASARDGHVRAGGAGDGLRGSDGGGARPARRASTQAHARTQRAPHRGGVLDTFCEDLDRDGRRAKAQPRRVRNPREQSRPAPVADPRLRRGTEKHARLPVRAIGGGCARASSRAGSSEPETRRRRRRRLFAFVRRGRVRGAVGKNNNGCSARRPPRDRDSRRLRLRLRLSRFAVFLRNPPLARFRILNPPPAPSPVPPSRLFGTRACPWDNLAGASSPRVASPRASSARVSLACSGLQPRE